MTDDSNSAGKGRQKRVAKGGRSLIGPDGKHLPSQQAGRLGAAAVNGRMREVPPPEKALPMLTGGRPTACTPEVIDLFARLLATGAEQEDAAWACHVHPATVANWMLWGEQGREPYRTFLETAMTALGSAVGGAADRVRVENPLGWLAHVRPKRWSPRANVDVTSGGQSVDELLRRAIDLKTGAETPAKGEGEPRG